MYKSLPSPQSFIANSCACCVNPTSSCAQSLPIPFSDVVYAPLPSDLNSSRIRANPNDVVCFYASSRVAVDSSQQESYKTEVRNTHSAENQDSQDLRRELNTEENARIAAIPETRQHKAAYRSILKQMYEYTKTNKDTLIMKLISEHYSKTKIQRCFNKISAYSISKQGKQQL